MATVPIDKALISEIKVSCNDKVVMPLNQTEKENVYIKKVLPTKWVAPIKEGETVGELQVICDGVILAKVPLTAEESINKANLLDYIKQWLKK